MAQCPFANNLYGEGRQCPETSEGFAGCYLWGTGCPNRAGGIIYSKTMTMVDDAATRFETTKKTLKDILIRVEDNQMLLGALGDEVYHVDIDEAIGYTKLDVSTQYFKNKNAGQNGKITILGVED